MSATPPPERTPERTRDGRYIVVGGRRWRATDPAIPERFRAELVTELMAARRAVAGVDGDAERAARRRVQDAKMALGERGEPWWEPPSEAGRANRIAATMLTLLRARADSSSICPSDVARTVGGAGWRALLDDVRAVAATAQRAGEIRITQGDRDVTIRAVRGPIRLRRGPEFPDPPD